jgi:hypothetical protein
MLPILGFSQDTLTYKSGGRVFNSENKKLTPSETRSLFANTKEALTLYNSGRTKKTLGNILLYSGITTLIIKRISDANKPTISSTLVGYNYQGAPIYSFQFHDIDRTLYYIGGAMVIISIPIKLGFSKKIKKALSLINEDFKKPNTGLNIESTSFISNANGFGISITF